PVAAWKLGARSPHVDAGEQEQPNHVDEMPVPSRELQSEMLFGIELPRKSATEAYHQEDRSDDHVRAVKARRHEERRAVDIATVAEGRMTVLEGLYAGEHDAQDDGADQTPLQPLAIVLQERVVRPGHGGARGEQDQRVEQRKVPRVEGLNAF